MNKSHSEAHDFLARHALAVLSTSTKEGKPWGSAIYYAIDELFTFFFVTHSESRKCQTIRENSQVALTVVNNEEQVTVQVSGVAVELRDASAEFTEAFRKLANIHPPGELSWTPPVSKLVNGKNVVFKIEPTELRFSKFTTSHRPPHPDIIQVI